MTTAYDRVAYPSAVFEQTHPERLAILARLVGLDPVPPTEARILEVGGGDCLNLLAMADVFPGCEAHGFDLSERAIAQGQSYVDGAGLANATLRVADILDAATIYPAGHFDYVIVHGVYAWVPDHVRAAIMPLIAHVLSPRGLAMVSYNAKPGGHLRRIMHEMMTLVMDGVTEPAERAATARAFLEGYVTPGNDDTPLHAAMRDQARIMLDRPDAVLFHDELGDHFHPQRLSEVVADARASGLRFLSDAGRNRHLDGLLADDAPLPADPDAAVLREAELDDFARVRFFRHTALARAEAPIDRRLDASRIDGLMLSTRLMREADGSFRQGEDVIEIPDAGLADAIERAAAIYPQRVPLADVARTPLQRRIVLQLFTEWFVNLHLYPAPFVAAPGERPQTCALTRAQLALGSRMATTRDHRRILIEQPEFRALLLAADGTRTLDEIAAAGHGLPQEETLPALTYAAGRGLLVA